MTHRDDTRLLLISGSLGLVLAGALIAGALATVHIVLILAAGIAVALYRELAPARQPERHVRSTPPPARLRI